MGWRKSSPVKVFCPAFLQKSGRGPGAEPWPRAAARGTLFCSQSAGGGQRGDPRRGSPLCGRPPPPAARATPRGRRWTKERVVEDADPYGGWETDRVPRDLPRGYPTPGRGLEDRGGVGGDRSGGTSRTPSPTGRLRRHNARSHPMPGGGGTPPLQGVGRTR